MSTRRARLVWAVTVTAVGLLEWREPLSPVLRDLFRTRTPLGRAVLTGSVVTASAWLIPHLCDAAEASLPS